jgi:hypothetical protein
MVIKLFCAINVYILVVYPLLEVEVSHRMFGQFGYKCTFSHQAPQIG